MKFEFTVGDWSCDGHNQSDNFVIETNVTVEQVRTAYGSLNKLPMNFDSWFENYEDRQITLEQFEELKKVLPSADKYFDEYKGKQSLQNGPEGYVNLWMDLIRVVDPTIELTLVNEGLKTINGGGYGLYWS